MDMINCAIYQACLPGKSDKRNIYPQSLPINQQWWMSKGQNATLICQTPQIWAQNLQWNFPFVWVPDKFEMVCICNFCVTTVFSYSDFHIMNIDRKILHVSMKMSYDHQVLKTATSHSSTSSFLCWGKHLTCCQKKLQETDFKQCWRP